MARHPLEVVVVADRTPTSHVPPATNPSLDFEISNTRPHLNNNNLEPLPRVRSTEQSKSGQPALCAHLPGDFQQLRRAQPSKGSPSKHKETKEDPACRVCAHYGARGRFLCCATAWSLSVANTHRTSLSLRSRTVFVTVASRKSKSA